MSFIEVTLLNGQKAAFRKDTLLWVYEAVSFTKEEIKNAPLLKDCKSCTELLMSGSNQVIYCRDSYEDIMQQLRD